MSQVNDGTLRPLISPATDVTNGMRPEMVLAGGTSGAVLTVGGTTPRLKANFSTPINPGSPTENTAYSAGDLIANSRTAGSVVPLEFQLSRNSGRILGCRCVVAPESGNLAITALDFDLLLFRPEADIPFAAGAYPADNAPLVVSAAMMRELVGTFRFSAGSWRNPAGTLVAGVAGYQSQALNSSRVIAPFNVNGLSGGSPPAACLLGLVQALGAWTPGAVINRFDFALDVDLD